MEKKDLVITCILTLNNQQIPTHTLIDCGATGIALMDQDFTCHYQIPLQELKQKKHVEVIDGSPIESGDSTHIAKVGMKIQGHGEQWPIFITKLGHYRIFLGIPGLGIHDVAVRFASITVTFGSQYYIPLWHDRPVTVEGSKEQPPEPVYQDKEIFELQIRPQRPFRGNIVTLNVSCFFQTVRNRKITIFEASL